MSINSILNDLFVNNKRPRTCNIFSDSPDNPNTIFANQVQESILNELKGRCGEGDLDDFIDGYISDYSDAKFAEKLQFGTDQNISTDRTINWQATGESVLTGAQIDYLKDHYNIENMSAQDYYNLMADLTDMNVVSGKDVAKYHVNGLPVINGTWPSNDRNHGTGGYVDKNGESSKYSGDVYGNVLTQLGYLSDICNMINPGGQFGSALDYLKIKELYEERLSLYGKFTDIYEKLL